MLLTLVMSQLKGLKESNKLLQFLFKTKFKRFTDDEFTQSLEKSLL